MKDVRLIQYGRFKEKSYEPITKVDEFRTDDLILEHFAQEFVPKINLFRIDRTYKKEVLINSSVNMIVDEDFSKVSSFTFRNFRRGIIFDENTSHYRVNPNPMSKWYENLEIKVPAEATKEVSFEGRIFNSIKNLIRGDVNNPIYCFPTLTFFEELLLDTEDREHPLGSSFVVDTNYYMNGKSTGEKYIP